MPTVNGKFSMNPQQGRALASVAKPSAAPDAGSPNVDDEGQQAITITKQADGTFHTSEPNGDEADFPDFQSAMGKAAECFGEGGEDADQDQGAGAAAGASSSPAAGPMGY